MRSYNCQKHISLTCQSLISSIAINKIRTSSWTCNIRKNCHSFFVYLTMPNLDHDRISFLLYSKDWISVLQFALLLVYLMIPSLDRNQISFKFVSSFFYLTIPSFDHNRSSFSLYYELFSTESTQSYRI